MREVSAPNSQTITINQDFTDFTHAIKIYFIHNSAKL